MAAAGARAGAYGGTGTSGAIAANRITYALGLKGPSLVVDTACSSSLSALHLACRALRGREIRRAIVGAADLIVSPRAIAARADAGMLAADSRCKPFDAKADGYVRGEGAACVVLKRAAEVTAADDVVAIIRGTAINNDGRTARLTAPSGAAQRALIDAALADGGVTPAAVRYVEAHGTGTALGDPIEMSALGAALAADAAAARRAAARRRGEGHVGHLEGAAGLLGVVKTALVLHHAAVPPNANFEANPLLADELRPGRLALPLQLTPLPRAPGAPPRRRRLIVWLRRRQQPAVLGRHRRAARRRRRW